MRVASSTIMIFLLMIVVTFIPSSTAAQLGAKDKAAQLNDVRQVALFYASFHADKGRAPRNKDELKESLQKESPKLWDKIDQGDIIVVYDAKVSSNVVVAYTKNPDAKKNHVVAMGDASVSTMTADELKKALEKKE